MDLAQKQLSQIESQIELLHGNCSQPIRSAANAHPDHIATCCQRRGHTPLVPGFYAWRTSHLAHTEARALSPAGENPR